MEEQEKTEQADESNGLDLGLGLNLDLDFSSLQPDFSALEF